MHSKFICRYCEISRALSLTLLGVLLTTSLAVGLYYWAPKAEATPGMLPFGGFILYNVPAPVPNILNTVLAPVPPCPAHIVITDYSLGFPKVIGITLDGLSEGPTFLFDNLFTPGVGTLGEYEPVPLPLCSPFNPGVYYPVFNAFLNPGFGLFQMGTALVPAT